MIFSLLYYSKKGAILPVFLASIIYGLDLRIYFSCHWLRYSMAESAAVTPCPEATTICL